jgi:hypothetical protein
MKDITVEYHNEVTINLGNFENMKPGYRLSATLEEGENPHGARAKLKATVDGWLEADVDEARKELNS